MRHSRVSNAGFTLAELLMTMALFATISLIAAPRVSELLESFSRSNAEMQVLQDMRLMQATTVEQGCQGIVSIAADGKSYSYGCDYVPFSAVSPPVWDSVRFTHSLPPKVTVATNGQIIFNSRGQAVEESGALATRTISLSLNKYGAPVVFNIGTLRPTGFFSYQN